MHGCKYWGVLALLLTISAPVTAQDAPHRVTTLQRPTASALTDVPPPADPMLPSPQPFIPPQADITPPPSSVAEQAFGKPIQRSLSFQAEAALLFPVVHQNLRAPVTVDNLYTTTARLPSADLDVAGAISFNLVYDRFGPGVFSATYRLLATEGCNTLIGFDPTGDAFLRSRINMNTVDLDYASRPKPLGLWTFKWEVGARLSSVFFDSQADGPVFQRHISNYFFGAGPHAAVAATRTLGESRLALYGRVDGGVVFGQSRQQFSEIVFDLNNDPFAFGYTAQSGGRGVPVLTAQFGLSGAPCDGRWGRWQAGYQFEQWWSIGNVGRSSADIILQGLFGRWTYMY